MKKTEFLPRLIHKSELIQYITLQINYEMSKLPGIDFVIIMTFFFERLHFHPVNDFSYKKFLGNRIRKRKFKKYFLGNGYENVYAKCRFFKTLLHGAPL